MFGKLACISFITILVCTSVLMQCVPAGASATGKGPEESALFDMSFEGGKDTYDLFTETGITVHLTLQASGFTPVSVTVGTDSPYCAGANEQDVTVRPDRETRVSFSFNWGRELYRGEEFTINFTGSISGAPSGTGTERLTAVVRSAAVLDGTIISFAQEGGKKKGGEEVIFRTLVMNTGNMPATFMVKLLNGKNEVENRTEPVDVNATVPFEILWVAKEGSHKFQAQLFVVTGYVDNNPLGAQILESLAQSEIVTVEIEAGNILTQGVNNNLFLVVVFVILLVVVVIAILNRKKIKKFIAGRKGKKK